MSGPNADHVAGDRRARYAVIAAAAICALALSAAIGSAVAQPDPKPTVRSNGEYGKPDHLFSIDSPWNTKIAKDPAIDPDSASIVTKVLDAPDLIVNMNLISFGQPFYTATSSTPKVKLTGSPIGAIPIDPTWGPNAGSDLKMNVIDPTTHTVYELQGFDKAKQSVTWAVKHDYTKSLGDGYPTDGELEGPTGSGMSQAAGAIRTADLEAGRIDHALSFITSTPLTTYRYPASHSDGTATGIGVQEGMRIQLDPAIDVDTIPNITPAEKMIFTALQKYGAYCSDNGGGNNQAMGFYIEKPTTATQSTYDSVGLTHDWQVLEQLPRGSLRVLAASVTPRP